MTQKPVAEWDRLAQCKHLDQLGDGDKEDNVTRDDEVEDKDNVKTLKEAINQFKELRLQLWVLLWCRSVAAAASQLAPPRRLSTIPQSGRVSAPERIRAGPCRALETHL